MNELLPLRTTNRPFRFRPGLAIRQHGQNERLGESIRPGWWPHNDEPTFATGPPAIGANLRFSENLVEEYCLLNWKSITTNCVITSEGALESYSEIDGLLKPDMTAAIRLVSLKSYFRVSPLSSSKLICSGV